MRKKMIFLIFFIVTMMSYSLSFDVYPTSFKVDASKVITEEATIINNTLEPLRVEIYTEEDEEFGKGYDLNSNITIFPKTVSIKAGGTQKVRFRVKPSENMKDGVNKSFLTFKEIPYEVKSTEEEENKEMSANLKTLTILSVPVYTIGQNLVKNIELKDIKLEFKNGMFTINGVVLSKGNSPVYLKYILKTEDGSFKSEGGIGNTARVGEKKIGISFVGDDKLKGKKVNLQIVDSENKVYYDKKIQL